MIKLRRQMGDSLNEKQAEILKEIMQNEEAKAQNIDSKQEWGTIVEGGEKDASHEKPKKKKR